MVFLKLLCFAAEGVQLVKGAIASDSHLFHLILQPSSPFGHPIQVGYVPERVLFDLGLGEREGERVEERGE